MKNIKKILYVLPAIVFFFALIGCEGHKATEEGGPSPSSVECSKVDETCSDSKPCCAGLACDSATSTCKASEPSAVECSKVDEPCSDSKPCCTGLACDAATSTCKESTPSSGGLITPTISLLRLDGTEMDFAASPIPRAIAFKISFDRAITVDEQKDVEGTFILNQGSTPIPINKSFVWAIDRKSVVVAPVKWLKYGTTYSVSTNSSVLSNPTPKDFKTAIERDFNGDGIPDILVGAPGWDSGDLTGKAYLFFLKGGTPLTISGKTAGDALGRHVAWAGDVNADGYADIIVGAPHVETEKGRAYILLGGPNVQGNCDLAHGCVIGSEAFPGVELSGQSQGSWFGYAVSSAGDIDGDGFDDVIVGAPGANEAHFFFGNAEGTNFGRSKIQVAVSGNQFGSSVSAGDFDGDGLSDVVVGSPRTDSTGNGSVYIYFGPHIYKNYYCSGSSCFSPKRIGLYISFGFSVANGGDLNCDGYQDLVVGAPGNYNDAGIADVFYGAPSPNTFNNHTDIKGDSYRKRFGQSVSAAGDVDGDGCDDLLIGAPLSYVGSYGAVYLFKGSKDGVSDTWSTLFTGHLNAGALGQSVSVIGDIDSDGLSDIMLGAPGDVSATGFPSLIGRSYIFKGTKTLPKNLVTTDIHPVLTGESAKDQFGW